MGSKIFYAACCLEAVCLQADLGGEICYAVFQDSFGFALRDWDMLSEFSERTVRALERPSLRSSPHSRPSMVRSNLQRVICAVQGSSEVSEEDYKRIHAARKQHEMEMQAQARRELRAARRKASAERAASERAKQQSGTEELAASSAPAIASRSDTRPGQSQGEPCQCSICQPP